MLVSSCCAELDIADRRQKREIRHLEQELPKWQVLVDSVTGQCSLSLSFPVRVGGHPGGGSPPPRSVLHFCPVCC